MRPTLRSTTLVLAAALTAACGIDRELPLAPDAATQPVTQPGQQGALGLTRKRALSADLVASATIGPLGGSIAISGAGFRLTVPAGAVSVPTLFKVKAFKGSLVAYEFEPHGLVFATPVLLHQDLSSTNWTRVDLASIEGAYFAQPSQLDFSANSAIVDEFLPTSVDPLARKAGFPVSHFSGYMLSSGRTTTPPLP